MKIRKIKRLFNGLASLRDYEVEDAISSGGIILDLEGRRMTLTPEQLKGGFSINNKAQISKFGGTYKLVDYRWKEDSLVEQDLFDRK